MFQISGFGAIDTGEQHNRPDPYGTGGNPAGGGGGAGTPTRWRGMFSYNAPAYRTWQAQPFGIGPAQPTLPGGTFQAGGAATPPPTVPDPVPPVLQQNPTPGQTVVVGAQPGTPAYDDMVPWWQTYKVPLMILGAAALLGAGYYFAKR